MNIHKGVGISLFDSLEDRETTMKYIEILSRFTGQNQNSPRSSVDKAQALFDIVQVVDQWHPLRYLRCRTLEQEIETRYGKIYSSPGQEKILLKSECTLDIRITPIYAPNYLGFNFLTSSTGNLQEDNRMNLHRLLFLDVVGRVIEFLVATRNGKELICKSPHQVDVRPIGVAEFAHLIDIYPLLADICLRNLIDEIQTARARAYERITGANVAEQALSNVIEVLRSSELQTQILLFVELQSRMTPRPTLIAGFSEIARMAGPTPEERMKRLEEECQKLRFRNIWEISGLPKEQAMQIIADPDSVEAE